MTGLAIVHLNGNQAEQHVRGEKPRPPTSVLEYVSLSGEEFRDS